MGDIVDGVRKVSRGGLTVADHYSNGDGNSSSASAGWDSRTVAGTGIRALRILSELRRERFAGKMMRFNLPAQDERGQRAPGPALGGSSRRAFHAPAGA